MKTKQSDIKGILPTTHRKTSARLAATLALLTLLALPAGAQTVLNHSFETTATTLADGGDGLANDWTHFITGGALGNGAYNPLAENFTGTAGTGTATGGDGANVFSNNAGTTKPGQAGAYQVISDTLLTAGTTYTLTVAVGDYKGLIPTNWHLAISTSSMAFGTFLADLAGLASALTDDELKDFTITYTATGLETQIGENLKITLWAQNDGAGQYVPFDNVRFTAVDGTAPTSTLAVTIAPTDGSPGNYDFTWNSQAGKVYKLVSSTDLATAPASWGVWESHSDLPASTNTLTNVPGGGETKRFFSVIEEDAP